MLYAFRSYLYGNGTTENIIRFKKFLDYFGTLIFENSIYFFANTCMHTYDTYYLVFLRILLI